MMPSQPSLRLRAARVIDIHATESQIVREIYRLGSDEAFRDSNSNALVFTTGGENQTTQKFQQSVISRFGTPENFRTAWDEAERIVSGFDRAILESRQGFYEEVYKPRRDELSDSWTQRFSPPKKPGGNPRSKPVEHST
jgi:hypothetical protein